MKKVLFALTIVGLVSMTACKKEGEKVETTTDETTTEQTIEETTTEESTDETVAEVDSDIPQFENADLQAYAKEYADYYKEVTAAAASGDQAKGAELAQKGAEFAKKTQELTQNLSPEDAQKFGEWAAKLAQQAAQ